MLSLYKLYSIPAAKWPYLINADFGNFSFIILFGQLQPRLNYWHITQTQLFKYIDDFMTKKGKKKSDKKF